MDRRGGTLAQGGGYRSMQERECFSRAIREVDWRPPRRSARTMGAASNLAWCVDTSTHDAADTNQRRSQPSSGEVDGRSTVTNALHRQRAALPSQKGGRPGRARRANESGSATSEVVARGSRREVEPGERRPWAQRYSCRREWQSRPWARGSRGTHPDARARVNRRRWATRAAARALSRDAGTRDGAARRGTAWALRRRTHRSSS